MNVPCDSINTKAIFTRKQIHHWNNSENIFILICPLLLCKASAPVTKGECLHVWVLDRHH